MMPKIGNKTEIDRSLLKPIKKLCQTIPNVIQDLYYYLATDLKNANTIVRFRALSIINYLVLRSKMFRTIVFFQIKDIALSCGLISGVPHCHDAGLQNKGKELFEIWDYLYGRHSSQLRAISRYFRESLKLDMPNVIVSYCSLMIWFFISNNVLFIKL